MQKTFKFHEFISMIEDQFVGKDIDAISIFVSTSDGNGAKAHMSSVPSIFKPKTEAEEREATMTALIHHYLVAGWEIFCEASPKNKIIMRGAFKVLAAAIENGEMQLPKETVSKKSIEDILNLMSNTQGNA